MFWQVSCASSLYTNSYLSLKKKNIKHIKHIVERTHSVFLKRCSHYGRSHCLPVSGCQPYKFVSLNLEKLENLFENWHFMANTCLKLLVQAAHYNCFLCVASADMATLKLSFQQTCRLAASRHVPKRGQTALTDWGWVCLYFITVSPDHKSQNDC